MEWEGLDELIEKLEMSEDKVPKVLEKLEEDVAQVVLDDVVENTPVSQGKLSEGAPIHTGDLKKGWKLRSTDGIEVYNDTRNKEEYYAWDVEYGHRTRAGMHLKQSTRRKKELTIKVVKLHLYLEFLC